MDVEALSGPDSPKPAADGTVLSFQNIRYCIHRRKRGPLFLLGGSGSDDGGGSDSGAGNAGLSGFLLPGQMLCVLGPSGCGKTTLLDVLSGRKTTGSMGGDVLLDGQRPTPAALRRHLGYVEQQDSLLGMLTPREMLMYTAELKQPRSVPRAAKAARVAELLARLGLERCQHTVIGSPLRRGVSGGEAKRCNIGIALVTSPRVLLVDELTSGLDSFYGGEVALVVQDLARSGIAVAASIHSPPPAVFAMFDAVLLLQRGRAVYFGPNGPPLLQYFAATFPELRAPGPSEGAADFIVDVTTRADTDPKQASLFADAYAASPLRADNDARLASLRDAAAAAHTGGGGGVGSGGGPAGCGWCGGGAGTVTPCWHALLVLYRYRTLCAVKRADYVMPRIGDKVIVTFLVATIYWGTGDGTSPEDAANAAAVLFVWALMTAFSSMGILPCLVLERPVYIRERSDGLYRPLTYAAYKVTEEVGVGLLPSLVYSLLVFYLVRLQGSFALFWLVYAVSLAVATVLALLAGALSPSVDVAGAVLPAFATTLFFFAGFMIPYDELPVYWKWYAVVDYLRYGWGALMANQFGGERDVAYRAGDGGTVTVLQFYGLTGVDGWLWLLYEACFFFAFALMLWAALVWLRHQRR